MISDPVEFALLYFIMPLWFLAGVADWLCHRASDIEHTTGVKESIIHLLMFAEVGIPLMGALLLQINALMIAVMIAMFLLHEATALWDVSYAVTRRNVTPIEQHVHSFLEMLPLMALAFVSILHWPQFLALFGLGSEAPSFDLQWKHPSLPVAYVTVVLVAALVLELLPYLEELVRRIRAARRLIPRP